MLTVKDVKGPDEPIPEFIEIKLWEKEAIPLLNKIYDSIPKQYTDQFVAEGIKITTTVFLSELGLPLPNGNFIGIILLYQRMAKRNAENEIEIDVKEIRKWIDEAACLQVYTITNGEDKYDECYLNPDEGLWNYILNNIVDDPETFFK